MKRFLSLIFLILFASAYLFSQSFDIGEPGVRTYSSRHYGQESQNYSIAQDTNSIMYFGNFNGILEFDNVKWSLLEVQGGPVLAVDKINSKVLYGGTNQVGYIQRKDALSVLHEFKFADDYGMVIVDKIIGMGDTVFFTSNNRLFLCYDDTVNLKMYNKEGLNIFYFNGKLLVYLQTVGLFEWRDGNLSCFEETFFDEINIEDIIVINDDEFLVKKPNAKGFFRYSNAELSSFYTDVDDFLEDNMYINGIKYSKGYLFGSRHGGVVAIDNDGRYLFSLNNHTGLKNNKISDMYLSKDNVLWLATDAEIALVDLGSNLSFINQSYGFRGVVLSIVKFGESLFVGTVDGLYKSNSKDIYNPNIKEFENRRRFDKVKNINLSCWELKIINDKLFAITSQGVFLFESSDQEPQLIFNGVSFCLSELNNYADTFLVGDEEGLVVCKQRQDNKLDVIKRIPDVNSQLATITEDYFGDFWIGTTESSLYKLSFIPNTNFETKLVTYSSSEGLPDKISWVLTVPSFHGVLYATRKGVYKYNYTYNYFYSDTLLGVNFNKEKSYLNPLVSTKDNKIWYSRVTERQYHRETGVFLFNGAKKKYTNVHLPFSQLGDLSIETIYPADDGDVWFGSYDGIVRYDGNLNRKFEHKLSCYVRSISLEEDTIIYLSPVQKNNPSNHEISYQDKTIRFDFAAQSYGVFDGVKYQVKLNELGDNWSAWSFDTYKEYSLLMEGHYSFMVRAMDSYGNISDEAVIFFQIKPPFYRTWIAYILYVIILAIIIYLFILFLELRYAKEKSVLEKLVEERTNELVLQKSQTEQLVKKLLPIKTAEEIKETGSAKTRKYDMVTVLFADIQGFSKISETAQPEILLSLLNDVFVSFDKIISNYNVEKIKTIGDAYMCAGGMPKPDNTNAIEMVLVALEMQRTMEVINEKSSIKFDLRIGIHTGPVLAGIVGENKIEYDIWGDTVNIASRMESHGQIKRVNVSESTFNLVKNFFNCQFRGKIDVKYKGELEMYFIYDIKKFLSIDGDKITPNKLFNIKVQFIQYKEIQEDILGKLQANLPANLYYHNVKHTINVIYIVEKLGLNEGVSDEDMLVLKFAALFHDTGFLVSYDNNEKIGAEMAEQTLKQYKFSDEQIAAVKRIIMSTQMPQKPKDLLEMIICDADLDYLGRQDFIPISQNLFRELYERGKIKSIEEWNKLQYKFVLGHNYFTETGRKNRNLGKETILDQLQQKV